MTLRRAHILPGQLDVGAEDDEQHRAEDEDAERPALDGVGVVIEPAEEAHGLARHHELLAALLTNVEQPSTEHTFARVVLVRAKANPIR